MIASKASTWTAALEAASKLSLCTRLWSSASVPLPSHKRHRFRYGEGKKEEISLNLTWLPSSPLFRTRFYEAQPRGSVPVVLVEELILAISASLLLAKVLICPVEEVYPHCRFVSSDTGFEYALTIQGGPPG